MQAFDRSEEETPAYLRSEEAKRSRVLMADYMLTDPARRNQMDSPRSILKLDDTTVTEALNRLFRGKCAFCEAREPTTAYRFRPQAEALPSQSPETGHLYYVWLADAWENIYPICSSCRPAEPNYFPVRSNRARIPTKTQIQRYAESERGLFWRNDPPDELNLLLDPCRVRTDFSRMLVPRLDGVIWSDREEGSLTIDTFKLDAPARVRARAVAYEGNVDRLLQCFDNFGHDDSGEQIKALFDFAELEFGGTWFLLLRRLARIVARAYEKTPVLSRVQLPIFYRRLMNEDGAEARMRTALVALRAEDERGPDQPQREVAARPSRARVKSVSLTNFKGVESLTIKLPEDAEAPTIPGREQSVPALLIVGENATGKSSILEAIALAMSPREARDGLDLDRHDLLLDPEYLGQEAGKRRERADIRIDMNDGSSRTLTITEASYRVVTSQAFQLPPVFAYSAFRQYRDSARRYSAIKYIQNLFYSDTLLSNPEQWLLSLDDDHFQMVARALNDILSIERDDIDTIHRDFDARRCILTLDVSEGAGERFSRTPLGVVSSGFRSVLAMVCDVMAGLMNKRVFPEFETIRSARGILLIDEIEAHLHPRWKIQIMRGLRKALPNMTIIATTHDPLCIRGMGDREVRVLQRIDGAQDPDTQLPIALEIMTDLPPASLMQIDQLLTSNAFQLFSTDSPDFDDKFAEIGDLLTKQLAGEHLDERQLIMIDAFERDVAAALPVGTSAAHRLVQEAVADYLRERRVLPEAELRTLRNTQRARIVEALKGI